MKSIFKQLHRIFYLFWVAFFFLALYPVILIASKAPVKFNLMNRLRRIFSYMSSSFSGIFYRVHFEKEVDWTKNYVICANHTSNLDITAMIFLLKKNFVFMGKDELLDNMVTGIYFRSIDIPLNRSSKMSAFRAFKRAGEVLQSGKHLVIFPEGLIGEHFPPVLQPFKNGPFKLAVEHNIPILPVTLTNNWKRMWNDGSKFGTSPGFCDICVHEPIFTADMSSIDADLLRDRVYEIIQTRLQESAGSSVDLEIPEFTNQNK